MLFFVTCRRSARAVGVHDEEGGGWGGTTGRPSTEKYELSLPTVVLAINGINDAFTLVEIYSAQFN